MENKKMLMMAILHTAGKSDEEILKDAADAIEGLSAKVRDAPASQENSKTEDTDGLIDVQRAIEALEALRMCEIGDCDENCRNCRRYTIPSADLISTYDTAITALRHGGNNIKRLKERRLKMSDAVKSPAHYVEGWKYEPKDVIRDWRLNFNLGCAVKYISVPGGREMPLRIWKRPGSIWGSKLRYWRRKTMTRKEILQIAKPILFDWDMIRAILDGKKEEREEG